MKKNNDERLDIIKDERIDTLLEIYHYIFEVQIADINHAVETAKKYQCQAFDSNFKERQQQRTIILTKIEDMIDAASLKNRLTLFAEQTKKTQNDE